VLWRIGATQGPPDTKDWLCCRARVIARSDPRTLHGVSRRTLEFGCAVILIGLLAGVAGMATTLLLHAVEHLTYHYCFGSLLEGEDSSSPVRRAFGPMIGGALAGFGWWMLRRRTEIPPLGGTIADHKPIPRAPMTIDAGLQVLLVGSGASLGREGAPRQFSAAMGDFGTSRWALTPRDREILLACAAGAGLAAVTACRWAGHCSRQRSCSTHGTPAPSAQRSSPRASQSPSPPPSPTRHHRSIGPTPRCPIY
jgi:hypothetical protein